MMGIEGEKPDLAFIHLSDIHFRKGRVGDVHDEDRLLRHELQIDLRRLRVRVPQIHGLIVSGDIAFSGKSEEYEYAESWLSSITEDVGITKENVMVTPGNHDVDRAAIPENGEVDALHLGVVNSASIPERDQKL